jgi:small GTP-binding protein
MLYISKNELRSLPADIGKLTNLKELYLDGNPLKSPPPEVVGQGTHAILAYLREQLKEKKKQWISKLLLVGEGGVGKTSLLRAIQGKEFIEGLETTHGIGVEKLEIKHPKESDVTMELNTWDFGGQQIYHATHQFFLTNRALFVVVWDARHGWEAGKLYEWLDRIQAKAPESPVMIVAAHIDERDADLPLEDLRKKYPQIEGHYKVSNKERTGIEKLRVKLAKVAADLPLMGEDWPASWLGAANAIREIQESYISPKRLFELMNKYDVEWESADVLANWLHELGDILYFKEDEELNDMVILDPVWVTEAISNVLESKEVIEKQGILTRQHSDELWADIDDSIRGHFLRLMERFDLSYRTLENREISLVVERLPLDPPDYQNRWDAIKQKEGCKEISMKFVLNSIPAGIPTWFIARTHRFTTHTHWRNGAMFADGKENRHLALVESYPHDRYLRLTVRGPAPQNFFTLLRDGLELTLARFPGLRIIRSIPCPGHDAKQCCHEFDFSQLEKAVERRKPPLEIQCPESFEYVSVPGLLFGLHWSTEGNVIDRIDELKDKVVLGQEKIRTELQELKELTQREFLRLFTRDQRLTESHCPNVFALLPKDEKGWLKNIFGQKMILELYCQAPGQWHPAVEGVKGGRYEIKQPAEFFKEMGPYILKLAKVIKYAAPVVEAAAGAYAGPIGAVMGAEYAKELAGQIKLMEELATKLSERDFIEADLLERTGVGGRAERIEGMELRALRNLLDEVDPQQEWGGLKKVLTPEGHYLWLCDYHAAEYKK